MKPDLKPYEGKMQKSLDVLAENLAGIRAGRANASVLNKITVDYYGTASPIQQVAAVASPDPRTLTIQPWDASLLKEIVKAIQTSELGINPQNDGKLIRLSFPPLTEERRKELIKQVSKEGEASKVAIRNIRRDAIDKWKAAKKKSEITEDELADAEKDMQKLTDKYIKEIDKTTAAKSEELKLSLIHISDGSRFSWRRSGIRSCFGGAMKTAASCSAPLSMPAERAETAWDISGAVIYYNQQICWEGLLI